MQKSFDKIIAGYKKFQEEYCNSNNSLLSDLATHGQSPEIMFVACCDSRVDPALILQCSPGDLFIMRNVANLIPPYESDEKHHGTSAALEFGICYLKVKHLIILGHSGCGGIKASMDKASLQNQNDFIGNWVDLISKECINSTDPDEVAKESLCKSHDNCLTFPWIKDLVANNKLQIHRWFFDIKSGVIQAYDINKSKFCDFSG